MQPIFEAVVLWYNYKKGYGFASVQGLDKDIMIHQSVIDMEGFRKLEENQSITIVGVEEIDGKLRALEVRV